MRRLGFLLLAACAAPVATTPPTTAPATTAPPAPAGPTAAEALARSGATWTQLTTVPFKGKQDDLVFTSIDHGFYGNGQGFIYRTDDGGATFTEVLHKPGTFIRAIGFVDATHGFAGNVGTDYYPGVTDETPLYETKDAGATWTPVVPTGAPVKGVCGIDVLHSKRIFQGALTDATTIRAAGRVGGPASMATSRDGGATWTSEDLSKVVGMILDVHFVDEQTGFLCAASSADAETSHARIVKTTDGGTTWRTVYESTRPTELTWKCAFPTRDVGYATVQSYDPKSAHRVVAKTTDGGETWTEIPLVTDAAVLEFGVGFADANVGWVGAKDGMWQTLDGGATWTHVAVGRGVNKIRVLAAPGGGFVAYAIGVDVYKLDARVRPSAAYSARPQGGLR